MGSRSLQSLTGHRPRQAFLNPHSLLRSFSALLGGRTPKRMASDLYRRLIPCDGCRLAQQGCKWSDEDIMSGRPDVECLRCKKLKRTCSGPSSAPTKRRKATARFAKPQEVEMEMNLAPSCSSNGLAEATMTSALTYELVNVYREHMRMADLDPEFEPFRQSVLRFNGFVNRKEELDQLPMLLFMLAGAKLSSHSAVIGSRSMHRNRLLSPPGTSKEAEPPDLTSHGLTRERLVQSLSAKILPQLLRLHDNLSSPEIVQTVLFTWMALDELGSWNHDEDQTSFIRSLMRRFNDFVDEEEEARKEGHRAIGWLLARQPSYAFLAYLAEDADGIMTGSKIPLHLYRKLADATPTMPLCDLSPSQLDILLSSEPLLTSLQDLVEEIRTPPVGYLHKLLNDLVLNPAPLATRVLAILESIDSLQPHFSTQFSLVMESWSRLWEEDERRVPIGAKRALRVLFSLETILVTCVWTFHRELVKGKLAVGCLGTRLDVIWCQWTEHTTIVKYSCDQLPDLYYVATIVTQALDFMKGPRLTEWITSFPILAKQLLEILNHASFSHASASRLVLDFRKTLGMPEPLPALVEIIESPVTNVKKERLAEKIVSGALGAIEEID